MMNEHEADQAVQSAFDALDARGSLSDALKLFIRHGDRTSEYFRRALAEVGDLPEGRRVSELLASELEWAKSLLQMIEDHNRSIEAR